MENERCDFCHEGRLKAQNVREYYRYQGDLVIIDNVPAYVCNTCGEHYHLAPVAKKLRNIAENRSKIEKRISIPITTFDNLIFERVKTRYSSLPSCLLPFNRIFTAKER